MTAEEKDLHDPLADFRDRFAIGDPKLLYLDGNSLGPLPLRTIEVVQDVVARQWGSRLIRAWNEGWRDLPTRVGDKIGRLIGARAGEVVACDSTSVNFYKLAYAVLAGTDRRRIVSDRTNFPSDLYLLQGLANQFSGTEIVYAETEDPEAIEALLTEDVALLTLSHVEYRTGRLHDMARLTAAAHAVGATTLWDLSHSAGSVDVDVEGAGCDLAVGCTYKHLCGGPGGVAYLYVRQEHQDRIVSPIQGWFGQRNAFDFDLQYTPQEGIGRMMAGTPPVISLAAVEPGLDLLLEAGMERVRAKSLALTGRIIELTDESLRPYGFQVLTPRPDADRGSHVTLTHPEAWRINQALIHEMNLIPDFRAPDGLRLGVAGLYNSFAEIDAAMASIGRVMKTRIYEKYPAQKAAIT